MAMYTINDINTHSLADVRKLEFYGTVGEDRAPHITLLNSMYRLDNETIVWGEYCHGYSKINQLVRPDITFLSLDNAGCTGWGRAIYDHNESSGEIHERFNSIPRYRYNTLYGYLPIHFLKLQELHDLQVPADTGLELESRMIAERIHPGNSPEAISVLTRQYFEAPANYKVIGWLDKAGAMQIVPLHQCVLTSTSRAVFAGAQKGHLADIPAGAAVAVYCVEFGKMFSVMLKGALKYINTDKGPVGVVEIESVYNPMMPKNCYIFPKSPIMPIRAWKDTLYEYNV